MKKIMITTVCIALLIASPAWAAWTGTLKEVKKNSDGTKLQVTVVVTDGTYSETLDRPFTPTTISDLKETIKNHISEVKNRKAAIDAVKILLPEAEKEVNKPVPEAV